LEQNVLFPLTNIPVRTWLWERFPVNIALTGWGARSSSAVVKRLRLIIAGVVCTVAVADAQSLCVQSKPARGHANLVRVADSALRSGDLGGISLLTPNAPPVDAGITAIALFLAMPPDDHVRFGVSDSRANAQGPGKEVEGPEVLT
jgi:hypothetical protein